MASCPKCNKSIPATKVIALTNFSKLTCEGCGSALRADRKVSMTVGGLGGGIGALLGIWVGRSGGSTIAVIAFVVFLLLICFISVKFSRLVLDD